MLFRDLTAAQILALAITAEEEDEPPGEERLRWVIIQFGFQP
jgi:hypothetical protein